MQTISITVKEIKERGDKILKEVDELCQIRRALDTQIYDAEEAGTVPYSKIKKALKVFDLVEDVLDRIYDRIGG